MNKKINLPEMEIINSLRQAELISENLFQFNGDIKKIKNRKIINLVFRIRNDKHQVDHDFKIINHEQSDQFGISPTSKEIKLPCWYRLTPNCAPCFANQYENVGVCSFSVGKNEIYIMKLGVIPEYRLQGIGSFIIGHIKSRFRNSKISLHTPINNLAAIQFYRRNGFRIIRMVNNYYGLGCYSDSFYMQS